MFASGDFTASTNDAVERWLVDDEGRDVKDAALEELWEEASLSHGGEDVNDAWGVFCHKNGIPYNNTLNNTLANDPRKVRLRMLRMWQGVAAVFIIGFFVAVGLILGNDDEVSSEMVQSYAPVAATTSIMLPDGTEVQLNSRSLLLFYPAKFEGGTRSVFLVGEACFKVKPDKEHPFIDRKSTRLNSSH